MAVEPQTIQQQHIWFSLRDYIRRIPQRLELSSRNLVLDIGYYGDAPAFQLRRLDRSVDANIEYRIDSNYVLLGPEPTSPQYQELVISRDDTSDDLGTVMRSRSSVLRLVRAFRLPEPPVSDNILAVIVKKIVAVVAADAERRLDREHVRAQVRNRVRTVPAPRHGRERHWERGRGR